MFQAKNKMDVFDDDENFMIIVVSVLSACRIEVLIRGKYELKMRFSRYRADRAVEIKEFVIKNNHQQMTRNFTKIL